METTGDEDLDDDGEDDEDDVGVVLSVTTIDADIVFFCKICVH